MSDSSMDGESFIHFMDVVIPHPLFMCQTCSKDFFYVIICLLLLIILLFQKKKGFHAYAIVVSQRLSLSFALTFSFGFKFF